MGGALGAAIKRKRLDGAFGSARGFRRVFPSREEK